MMEPTRREAIAMTIGVALSNRASAADVVPTAMLRLSILGDEAFAPTEVGNLVKEPYDPTQHVGRLGTITVPTLAAKESDFRQYVEDTTRQRTPKLKNEPVVIMVHGFMADPREDVRPNAPQRSNNPHDFSYHYSPGPGPYWRHTASWPLGLGFAQNDGGASGFAVAFGWNSTPDVLANGFGAALSAARKKLSWEDLLTVPADLLELAAAMPAIVKAAQAIPVPLGVEQVRKGIEKLDDLLTAVEEPLAKLGDRLPDIYREPYQRADRAAWVLVNTIRSVAAALPNQPIDLFCHSLGSRVVVQALYQMAVAAQKPETAELKTVLDRVGRVIIVGGAEYTTPTFKMLTEVRKVRATGPTFYNFMARRDRILALLAQRFHPVELGLRRVIGLSGLTQGKPEPNWIDLQLDSEADGSHPLNTWLASRKMSVEGTHLTGVLNHWHYFTSPENMQVFRSILRYRNPWDIAELRRENIPERTGATWPTEQ